MCLSGNYKWNDGPYLILKDNPETSITICWITSKKKNSLLSWGSSESNLDRNEVSTNKRYHSVTLYNLSPDTNYFYTIKERLTLYSEGTVFNFRAAKEKKSDKNLEFIIAGDLQPKNKSTLEANYNMALQINSERPDFIIQMGDLVQIGSFIRYWHFLMKSLPLMASGRPFFSVIGNHEYYLFHKNKNFRSFFPYNYPSERSSYYSKNIGNIHLTFLDPYDGGFSVLSSKISVQQKEWFIKDLEKAVKDNSKWIFVVLHQAVLSTGEYSGDLKLQEWIVPILSKYDVDAVFWGHAHLYEHWQYQYGENGFVIDPENIPGRNPIHYFCIGSSGASLESHFKLFSHKPVKKKNIKWFNNKNGLEKKENTIHYPWNRKVYFERNLNYHKNEDRHFYHLPFDEKGNYSKDISISYNTENKWFGYMYGENTLHYAKININKNICTITIHYIDGTLLSGPVGSLPQQFRLKRKTRNILG